MANFPSTTEELEQYISDYMSAHVQEYVTVATTAAIAEAVKEYMEAYGAALEDNGPGGDVPLVDEIDADTTTMPLTRVDSNGTPLSFIQARIRAFARAGCKSI